MTRLDKNTAPEDRETHSSGDHADALNSSEDRLRADPALEPELARQKEEESLKQSHKQARTEAEAKAANPAGVQDSAKPDTAAPHEVKDNEPVAPKE